MTAAVQAIGSGILCLVFGIWAVWFAPEKYRRGWPRTYFREGSPLIRLRAIAAYAVIVSGVVCVAAGLYRLFSPG